MSGSSVTNAIRCCVSIRLARTMRWATVAAGRLKPRAISWVVRPATIRSVRATCPSVASSGWQHIAISRSWSSAIPAASVPGAVPPGGVRPSSSGRSDASRSCALLESRTRLRARLRHTVISQAPGRSGMPCKGHRSNAASSVSWATSSAACRSPVIRSATAMSRGHSSRNAAVRAASSGLLTVRSLLSSRPSAAAPPPGSRSRLPTRPPACRPPVHRWPPRSGRRAAQPQNRAAGQRTATAPSAAASYAMQPLPRHDERRRPGPVRLARQVPAAGCRPIGTSSSDWSDLTDLDRAELHVRAAGSDRGCRLDAERLDDEVAGNNLLRLGKRPVEDPLLAVAGADPLGLGHRVQRRAALDDALADQAHRVLADPLHRVLALLFGRDQLRVLIQHEHELHRSILLLARRAWCLHPLRHQRDPQIDMNAERLPPEAARAGNHRRLTIPPPP